ncbi:MAG: hypothetical protein FD189_1393 [Elusimicrobia bacterium]|nr:MAG: hypothetical protein FD154_1410 [Elusimicrobiota bacterium]KAF0155477.1 MAG: hypothetical protein FD189_1393 [Elusimicrobiota bacterium]
MKITLATLFLSLAAAPLAGPLAAQGSGQPSLDAPPIFDEGPGFVVLNPAAKTRLRTEAFADMVAESDVVYVGESHDQKFAHLAQLEALKIMALARKNKVVVGFEMLNSGLQPVLDRYAAGKMTEEEFLSGADWKKEWGFDFGLYKPLFDYIRKNKLKAAALNVPRPVIRKIARGGIGALSPEEKKFLPEKVEINHDPLYAAYLRATYGGHGDNPMAKMITWDNYLLSMAAWNEGMADSAVKAMRKHKGHAMLVIAGNGHVIYNAGIPFSIRTRIQGLKHLSIYTEDMEKTEAFRENPSPLADLVWFVKHERKPEPPAASTAAVKAQ